MKKVSKDTKDYLKTYFPFLKVRKNEIKFQVTEDTEYEIPGDYYPLRHQKTARVFSYADTKQLNQDSLVAKVYNSVSLETGFCYSNTEKLKEAFLKAGIQDIKTYTGWIFLQGLPVHHCWLVYKDIHVLDAGVTKIDDLFQQHIAKNEIKDVDEARLVYKEIHDEYKNHPNSEVRTFGRVAPFALYVGSETTPNQGREIYNEVIKKHPHHPSYQGDGMNANGRSKLQEMLETE